MGGDVKFWIIVGPVPHATDSHRTFFSYALLRGYFPGFLQGKSHVTRCKLWLAIASTSCKWGQIFFYLSISPCRARLVLRFIFFCAHVNSGGSYPASHHGYCIFRICFTLGTDIFLGGYGHHQSIFSSSFYWGGSCSMNVRRVWGG